MIAVSTDEEKKTSKLFLITIKYKYYSLFEITVSYAYMRNKIWKRNCTICSFIWRFDRWKKNTRWDIVPVKSRIIHEIPWGNEGMRSLREFPVASHVIRTFFASVFESRTICFNSRNCKEICVPSFYSSR